MPNGQDRKGRSKTGGHHVRLQAFMLHTPAWSALKASARAVYVEIALRYYGTNNGRLALSARDAARTCNLSKDTATKAFRQLVDLGFIECVTPGGFSRKVRHAAEWRLTEHTCDVTKALPTKGYMRWRPQTQKSVPNKGRLCPKSGTEG